MVCLALVGKKYIKTGINHKTIEKKIDIMIMCCIYLFLNYLIK